MEFTAEELKYLIAVVEFDMGNLQMMGYNPKVQEAYIYTTELRMKLLNELRKLEPVDPSTDPKSPTPQAQPEEVEAK